MQQGITAQMQCRFSEHEAGTRGGYDQTALIQAAERGHAGVVMILAPHESGLFNNRGECALMLAM